MIANKTFALFKESKALKELKKNLYRSMMYQEAIFSLTL